MSNKKEKRHQFNHRQSGFSITVSDDGKNYVLSREVTVKEGDNAGNMYLNTLGYFNNIGAAVRRLATIVGNEKGRDLREWLALFRYEVSKFEEAIKEVS